LWQRSMADRRPDPTRQVARLAGFAPSLPTPFRDTGELDSAALEWLCHRQVEESAAALVVCGVTAEAPTLTQGERETILRIAVDASRGRIPVIAAVASNSTSKAIEFAKAAQAAGAAAVLAVVPYYNKPTQSGMYAHFRAIAESTGLALILHDVPSRTVCGLADETIARLAEMPQVIGLVDATADLGRPLRLRALLGSEFRLLSADDATALAYFAQGGNGCISVSSNVAPGLCRDMHTAWTQGEITHAQKLAAMIASVGVALARESDPAPVKYALSLMKLVSSRMRLPLVEVTNHTGAEIEEALARIATEHPGYLVGNVSRIAPTAHTRPARGSDGIASDHSLSRFGRSSR
jgi:4-hydroxy-tetrahydrodipicolinate synthase